MKKQVLLLALGIAASACSARADMRWRSEMKLEGANAARVGRPGGAPPLIFTTTSVKDGAQRIETSAQMGMFSVSNVLLTLCDKKQRVRLDDKLKIYAVLPIDGDFVPQNPLAGLAATLGKMLPPGIKLPGLPQAPQGEPATGKVISTITAQDLGEDTVAETKTQHWMMTIKNENSGCAGEDTTTMKMEVWAAKLEEPVVCPDSVTRNPISDYQKSVKPQCKITTELRGDGMETFGKIFRGIPMRLKFYQGEATDKAVMTQEVTMLTRAKQDDALFSIPADYKEVKAEEFDQMRSQAMIRQLMGGFGGAQ